jgi:hypothetical protein
VDLPRAEVISEYILKYYLTAIAVAQNDKLVSTWGKDKEWAILPLIDT